MSIIKLKTVNMFTVVFSLYDDKTMPTLSRFLSLTFTKKTVDKRFFACDLSSKNSTNLFNFRAPKSAQKTRKKKNGLMGAFSAKGKNAQ